MKDDREPADNAHPPGPRDARPTLSRLRLCNAVDDEGMPMYRLTWEDAPSSTIHRPYYHFW